MLGRLFQELRPGRIGGQFAATLLAIGKVLVRPHVYDLVQRTDVVADVPAHTMAEILELQRQRLGFVELQVGVELAWFDVVSAVIAVHLSSFGKWNGNW